MKHLTDQILQTAIDGIPKKTFDTHRVIQEIMTIEPRQYANDLYAQNGNDPIMSLHSMIGTRLLQIPTISPTRKVVSTNVRGQDNENQEWVKI